MKLYHGSNVGIQQIDLSFSKPGKDFGCGFYLNPNYEQAKDMAVRVTKLLGKGDPVVSVFSFDETALETAALKVKRFDGYTTEWLEFVAANRRCVKGSAVHSYDIVVGPIANDTVGISLSLYISGFATPEETIRRLRFEGSQSIQYLFCTPPSLQLLTKEQP